MISHQERMLPNQAGIKPMTPDHQSDVHPTEPPRPAIMGYRVVVRCCCTCNSWGRKHVIGSSVSTPSLALRPHPLLVLSFLSSAYSSVFFLPFSGRQPKMTVTGLFLLNKNSKKMLLMTVDYKCKIRENYPRLMTYYPT